MTKRKGLDRREFVTTAGAAAIAAALGPTILIRRQQKTLKIIQWSHFVPAYDVWFDRYAKDWGTAKGVEVTVDHIALADLTTRANAEVAAQQGHDLFQFLSPPGAFEPQVLDMADVVRDAERAHGPLLDLCKRSTYNPVTRKWFGFSDNYVPDPGDYLKSIWTEIGKPDGPVTWEDLLTAAPQIKAKHPEIQIPIGIGMSQELDSNMAARAMLWSFDGSIQDANENVVLKSDQALEALTFGARLFQAGMTPAVLSWNAASNNQALNARATSYILNSISAYRTAQDNKLPVADDIFFVPALKGPRGTGWASEHVMGIYAIWKFAQSPDVAKQFLLDLVAHYRDAVTGSKFYNFPSYPGSVADPGTAQGQKPAAGQRWLEQATANDPFGSNPPTKLKPISTALQWATNIGHPGPANPAESEVFDTFVLPTMFANVATGRMTAPQALDDAHQQVKRIFEKWRAKGLVAGGAGDKA
ncbi:MAG: hypothetical protein DMD37_13000 [Gemmatimonadetes bacterium]|nr:MAG: hypothetical protein DMD37_13000 [Gemmatimonadota bacterium]